MKFYRIYAESLVEEYMAPGPELDSLTGPCARSEFQFLNREPLDVSLLPEGGIEFPDFLLYRDRVPLISEKFRQILDKAGADNLFYKRIVLLDRETGINEKCWLALPPRIQCLDYARSKIEVDESEFVPPEEWDRIAEEIVIDPEMTGNYKIFKLNRELINNEIVINEPLARTLEEEKLENVWIEEL